MHLGTIQLKDVTDENVDEAIVSAFEAVIANGRYGILPTGGCAYRVYDSDEPSAEVACCVIGAMLPPGAHVVASNSIRHILDDLGVDTSMFDPRCALIEDRGVDAHYWMLGCAQGVHDHAADRSAAPTVEALLRSVNVVVSQIREVGWPEARVTRVRRVFDTLESRQNAVSLGK